MDPEGKKSVEVREGDPSVPTKSEEPKAAESAATTQSTVSTDAKPSDPADGNEKVSKEGSKKKANQKKKSKKITPPPESSDNFDSDDGADAFQDDLDSDDSGSDSEDTKRKRVTKKRQDATKSRKKGPTAKKQKKSAKVTFTSSSSESSSSGTDSSDSDAETSDDETGDVQSKLKEQDKMIKQLQQLVLQQQGQGGPSYQQTGSYSQGGAYAFPGDIINKGLGYYNPPASLPAVMDTSRMTQAFRRTRGAPHPSSSSSSQVDPALLDPRLAKDKKRKQKATKLDFKRVDQVWDNTIHNYKLQDTAQGSIDAQYDEFLFHVRRAFDWEGKYKTTYLDIKSKLLRECLQDVIGNVKGVSLVEETPKMDPNLLFLYLEDLRKHLKDLKRKAPSKGSKSDRKKEQKRIKNKRQQLKVLIKYIDKDYAEVKKTLYPLLDNGLISFDLLWALWKPNTLAFTTTYGSPDQPRVFKVDVAEKHYSIMKGDYYYIEGKYFEYDGKQFGYGSMSEEIGEFRGARKITSLGCYPLKYHKNEAQVRKDLIERGKKFVSLGGVHYKSHQGMAYYKKKKSVIKVNINGRIMVDPSIHRRINPNYPISLVRPKDHDIISDDEESGDESGYCCGHDSDEDATGSVDVKFVTKLFKDDKGKIASIRLRKPADDDGSKEKFDKVQSEEDENAAEKGQNAGGDDAKKIPEFSDEEYLIASPVVLGFAFAEKLWLEFTVSGVREIQWNETAYQSLVLESKTKDIVKALVESHKYHAAESIDDVIQGKGKGLVAVLHGPPGTGKTLTAEGISELLKCPLYMVSAGELGTDSRFLESELQKILDICHAWGAILLLDEADVFLEKRNMHDIHRNALVSIFLRQLEYFQGILFLTTNRVETFDDAFQSRIHIALRYDNLDHKAKRAIFKIFIERVRILEKTKLMPFTDEDYNTLARHELNGRQIKNTVRTAQALAVNKGEPLAMSHIRQVLEVQANFERDLKGGPGYTDAMRSYF